jgi:copper(I)-binding protein
VVVPREVPTLDRPRRLWALGFAGVLLAVALLLVVVGVVALGRGGNDRPTSAASASASAKVTVSGAWTVPSQGPAAVYATIANRGGADRLTGVSGPGVGPVLLMGADGQVAHTSTAGATAVDLAVPHGVTRLQPGGRHLMLGEVASPLEAGTTLRLRLTFARAGPVTVEVAVLTPEQASARG